MHHADLLAEPRFWVAVAFVVFFVLFGKRLWTALADILDKRTESIRAELAEASRLRLEAEAMLRDAEDRRAAALRDARALLESAKTEAERIAAEAAEEAKAAAGRRQRMALDRIAAAEKAAVRDVQNTAAEIAAEAARQILAQGLGTDRDAQLIDRAIAQLPSALSSRRAA